MENNRASAFTNQNLIDAFYNVATALNLNDPWSLLIQAGLNLDQLATNRQSPYTGTAIDDLPDLTDDQRARLNEELERLSAKSFLWRGIIEAPAGLSLRTRPDADAERLTVLLDGAPVNVLEELGEWLRVRVDDQIGYVYRPYVIKDDGDAKPSKPSTRFLWQSPELASAPLTPSAEESIAVDPARMSGKQIYLARVWNRYGGLLQALADELGIDPSVAVAVFATEAGPYVLADDERMVIRFENHVFLNEWGRDHPEQFTQHFSYMSEPPGNSWKGHQWRSGPEEAWQPFHGDQDREWAVFDFACTLDNEAAKCSISMGIAQIMGFNHNSLGYESAQVMFDAFNGDVRRQIFGFFDFVRQRPGTVAALRTGDYLTFARIYNGTGQMDNYASEIHENNEAFHQLGEGKAVTHATPAASPPPMPEALPLPTTLGEPDPALQEAWREHIKQGFENNQKMFSQILNAFMKPYYTTVWMYRILFAVGILSFVAALVFAFTKDEFSFSLVFGGLSVASFLTYFLSKPLRSLEENLQFITWLGIIYNTYWTRQAFMLDEQTIQADLEDATQEAISQLEKLIDKNATLAANRPDLDDNS